jgi:flagellar M-ring protein FliF
VSSQSKPFALPAPLAAAITLVKGWVGRLSRPARILIVSTLAASALLIGYVVYNQTHEPYAVLFSQLEQDDAAGVVAKLKELKTPYRLEVGGSTVMVPESRVGEVRLDLASAGMPRGGGVGFESFDKMRLGATEFEQRVLYRRALEGELARTIGTLGSVQSARVHLVLPEKSVFVTRAEPASASIVLRLRSGRALGPSEVGGIVHLTAASVPGLTADRIALVTTDGEMLKRPRVAQDGVGSDSDEDRGAQQRAVEVQLEDRARSMLEKVVGAGHVDVRVTADLDLARVEHTEDHYDPAKAVLRSEESTVERSGPTLDDSVAGVPGAESNLPTGAGAAPTAAPAVSAVIKGDAGAPKIAAAAPKSSGAEQPFRESHTRNFEVDHVSDKRVSNSGTLRRIAVAVVLDGVPRMEGGKEVIVPRDRAELDKLGALVRSAVGANELRGDLVTVDSVPFQDARATADVPAAPAPLATTTRIWRAYLPAGAAAGVLLVIAAGASLVRRRRRKAREASVQLLPPVVAPQQLDASKSQVDVRAAAMDRAANDPATAALVLRAWLGTDGDTKSAGVR